MAKSEPWHLTADKEQTASQMKLLARAADARASAGRHKVEVMKIEDEVSVLEAEAAETAAEAQKVWNLMTR